MTAGLRRSLAATAFLAAFAAASGAAEEPPPKAPKSGYEFTMDWFTHAIPRWRELLAPWVGRPGVRYLEVGVFEGRSLLWMLDEVLTSPTAHATAVDPFFDAPVERRFRANLARSGHAEKVTVLKGLSQIELRRLPLESFDVIYIDGSHTADDVLADATLSWELLRVGGLLIFDDYRWTGRAPGQTPLPMELRPQFAINAFVTAYRNEIEIVERGYQMVLRKRVSACPNKWDCSPIGRYLYHWEDRQLRVADTGEIVPLTAEERDLVEQVAYSRRFGQVGYTLDPALRGRPGFEKLVKSLELELEPAAP
jgi:predicted O-methyltransferase YrrM